MSHTCYDLCLFQSSYSSPITSRFLHAHPRSLIHALWILMINIKGIIWDSNIFNIEKRSFILFLTSITQTSKKEHVWIRHQTHVFLCILMRWKLWKCFFWFLVIKHYLQKIGFERSLYWLQIWIQRIKILWKICFSWIIKFSEVKC